MPPVLNAPPLPRLRAVPDADHTRADDAVVGPSLAQQVMDTLSAYSEDGAVTMDETGTIVLAVDNVVLGIQVDVQPPMVRVFGLVESGVALDAERAAWLNEYNSSRIPMGYVFWRDGDVIYTNEVVADPFVADHLLDALAVASSLVPGLVREEEFRSADGDLLD